MICLKAISSEKAVLTEKEMSRPWMKSKVASGQRNSSLIFPSSKLTLCSGYRVVMGTQSIVSSNCVTRL